MRNRRQFVKIIFGFFATLITIKYFKTVKLMDSKDWPLPKSMYSKSNLLDKLKKKGHISFERKFGLILYTSDIYIAY